MADGERSLKIHIVQTLMESDVWCDKCRLASGKRIKLTGISELGVSDLGIVLFCRQCETVYPEKE